MHIAQLVFVVVFGFSSLVAHADNECTIVYGNDWAFMFTTPEKWASACHLEDQAGVSVALWPKNSTWQSAPGVMYINVSRKDGFSLEQFAEDELTGFRTESPGLKVQVSKPIPLKSHDQALVRELANDQYGNHELVAYADAGKVYLIFVLTSRNKETFDRFRSAFKELVTSMSPMKIEFQEAEKHLTN